MPYTDEIPEAESAIYEQLLVIRSKLSALKRDRTQYLTSKDVLSTYNEVFQLVKQLKVVRDQTQHQLNKVDLIIDDIFQLLSLFFITVGLINTAPATYASLTTVQRLLEHLNESSVYTVHDLAPIKQRLQEITKIVNGGEDTDGNSNKNNDEELALLKFKLKQCLEDYKVVESKVEKVDSKLQSLFEELVTIRRKLLSTAARPNFTSLEIKPIVDRLQELENHRDSSGKFQSLETDKVILDGQNVLNGLLDECHTLIDDLNAHNFKLDESLKPIYDRLINLKTSLEDLLVTRRWTLRQTDLYQYQKDIQEIDDLRVNGKFPTTDPSTAAATAASKSQAILLYLLRRCYAIIYKLLESSEPVSEALQPIHNQLSTVRRCLLELKRIGGINSARELYPYQMKLASLDNLRVDGKFIVDGQVPEGQGTLTALLAECYDICEELKIDAEEAESKTEDAEDEDGEIGGVYDNENVEYEYVDDEEDDYQEDEEDQSRYASYAPSEVEV
ncbi:hypothetical protein WICPIJ_009283 [Wickerhamomyces pijperi]|uniref:Uncharacterized protein n=1 Tax=Wickerhamomyces pijperi TaxID=599730 RepID=A0A9P8PP80_WICPI|nr:hypothetical protein WICPIJ_009283 [Wickerhamomyces pijperi]